LNSTAGCPEAQVAVASCGGIKCIEDVIRGSNNNTQLIEFACGVLRNLAAGGTAVANAMHFDVSVLQSIILNQSLSWGSGSPCAERLRRVLQGPAGLLAPVHGLLRPCLEHRLHLRAAESVGKGTSKSNDGLANGRLSIMDSSGCSSKTDSQAPLWETLNLT
jgi:hypothetical protein